jgi:hypothetical protein
VLLRWKQACIALLSHLVASLCRHAHGSTSARWSACSSSATTRGCCCLHSPPRMRLMSKEHETTMGSFGWYATDGTLPLCPGSCRRAKHVRHALLVSEELRSCMCHSLATHLVHQLSRLRVPQTHRPISTSRNDSPAVWCPRSANQHLLKANRQPRERAYQAWRAHMTGRRLGRERPHVPQTHGAVGTGREQLRA